MHLLRPESKKHRIRIIRYCINNNEYVNNEMKKHRNRKIIWDRAT